MANVRVDLDFTIREGLEVVFRAPCDCSAITGLTIYYPNVDGNQTSQVFRLVDAHRNNIGDLDELFVEGAIVKVILDLDESMAFVQNADTNKYLEDKMKLKNLFSTGPIILVEGIHYGNELPTDNSPETVGRIFFKVVE